MPKACPYKLKFWYTPKDNVSLTFDNDLRDDISLTVDNDLKGVSLTFDNDLRMMLV